MENLKYTEILHLNKELAKENFKSKFSAKILSNVTVNSLKEIIPNEHINYLFFVLSLFQIKKNS